MKPRSAGSVLLALALLTVVGGCSSRTITFEDSQAAYTADTVFEATDEAPTPIAHGKPVTDAEDLRHDALVDLRAIGGEAAEAADLLTTEFPSPSRSVPYHVEAATFEGKPAWVIIEVWGPEGGTLDQTRIWVFERETGNVLFTASIN